MYDKMALSGIQLHSLCHNDIAYGTCGIALNTFPAIVFSGLESGLSVLYCLARILLKDPDVLHYNMDCSI